MTACWYAASTTTPPRPAAGISEGDLLVRAGDHDLASADDLFAALADISPGSELAITLVRGSEELTVTATWPAAD